MAILDKAGFAERAHPFAAHLKTCSTFDQLHAAWQTTYLPYKMDSEDPFSPEYRDEVMSLYTSLSGGPYLTDNEMSSTKTSEGDFRIGFPWITKRLDIIGAEVAKVAQAAAALYRTDKHVLDIVEFGVGWGNLATPLAKAGQNMTVVDVDPGFLSRIAKEFSQVGLPLRTVQGDFIDAIDKLDGQYDAAVFQASFHHCFDFDRMLHLIRTRVLRPDGAIYFFSEPVFQDYPFPWGLRFDGESLWAIMIQKWLELGFRQDFFSSLLLRNGFFLVTIPPVGPVGLGWKGLRQSVGFEKWVMPLSNNSTFHLSGDLTRGRFCRGVSILPGLQGADLNCYELEFRNFDDRPLAVAIEAAGSTHRFLIAPQGAVIQAVPADGPEVVIRSTDATDAAGDLARGVALVTIGCEKNLAPNTRVMSAAEMETAASSLLPHDSRNLAEEVNTLQQQVRELTSSTSWKVTRPLRSIMHAIRGTRA